MTPPGPWPPGDDPEEGGGQLPPPEERTWRHPSELSSAGGTGLPGAGGAFGGPGYFGPGSPDWLAQRQRRRQRLMGAVGSVALMGAVGSLVLLWTVSSGLVALTAGGRGPTPSTAVTDLTSLRGSVPQSAVPAVHAMVALEVARPGGAVAVTGVVVGPGGLVAAPAQPFEGARPTVTVEAPRGEIPATEVALDPGSDLALVRVHERAPAAPMAPDAAPAADQPALVVSLTGAREGRPVVHWSTTTIHAVGSTVPGGDALADILTRVPPRTAASGALLLDARGDVLGMLEPAARPNVATRVSGFVPGPVLLGVTDQLRATGTVRHGWLDVMAADATSPTGAVVTAVDPRGAAAGSLQPGDVIESVSGQPVRSEAELRTLLYALPPGTTVALGVVRHGYPGMVTVSLGRLP